MNEDARRSGHLRPGCRGEWIDLTTLTDTQMIEKCPVCGAVRRGGPIDIEVDPMEVDDQAGEGQRPSLPLSWWWLVAVGCALGILVVVAIA